ncbi:MAG: hypothetical protein IV107_16410 [Paucibacter sp.]|nr:hypothetical protein [Roseateles sp.]
MHGLNEVEQVREARTPAEMRAEIARIKRQIYLVCASMDAADYAGMAGEDRYTMLAYHALAALQKSEKAMREYLLTTSGEMFLLAPKQEKNGWRPMETAPKVGPILLLMPEVGGWLPGAWRGSWSHVLECWTIHSPATGEDGRIIVFTNIPEPLGWRALPG